MALQNFGPTMFPVEVCTARAANDCVVEYYAEKPPVSIGEPIELCCAPRLPRLPSEAVIPPSLMFDFCDPVIGAE